MKRLVCLLLVLVLFPLVSLADGSEYVGCWASYETLTDGAPVMSMLYLSEDHTCYFVTQMFHPDSPGLGRSYVGTWEILSDGTLRAKTGNNTETKLKFYTSENYALEAETMRVYVNITPFTLK